MVPIDITDCLILSKLEDYIEELTTAKEGYITLECDLEIEMGDHISKYGIKPSWTPKQQYMSLKNLGTEEVKKLVDDWFEVVSNIRSISAKLRQVEGKRDSAKKIFDISPK